MFGRKDFGVLVFRLYTATRCVSSLALWPERDTYRHVFLC